MVFLNITISLISNPDRYISRFCWHALFELGEIPFLVVTANFECVDHANSLMQPPSLYHKFGISHFASSTKYHLALPCLYKSFIQKRLGAWTHYHFQDLTTS